MQNQIHFRNSFFTLGYKYGGHILCVTKVLLCVQRKQHKLQHKYHDTTHKGYYHTDDLK